MMKMQDSVLRRVRMVEEKNGIRYAKTDGRLYKVLRVVDTLLWAYILVIDLLFVLGMFLVYGGTDNFAGVRNALISVTVCTAVLIAGYILSFFRFKLAAGILSIAPAVFLIFCFAPLLEDSLGFMGYAFSFYWRHFAPLVLFAAVTLWMTAIAVRARIKTEKQYKKVTENLFRIYQSTGSELSDEQWEEFLRQYDPTDYARLFKENEPTNTEK